MSQPRVSIVIINWKTPQLLAVCLNSLLRDPLAQDFEIWVVDNASADGSVEMLAKDYPGVTVIANLENVGFAKACNQVIPQTQGPFILLLNPDTFVVDKAISTLVDYLEDHCDCGAVGPKVLNPDGSLQLACRRAFPTPAVAFYRLSYLSRIFPKHPVLASYNFTFADPDCEMEVDALSGSCMLVRREAIAQIGLLDEDIFMFGEDIDWCWRLKEVGWKICYVPEAVVYHHHGAASRLRPVGATINLHKGMAVFYRKHFSVQYPALFNIFVYLAISLRAAVFIVLALIKLLLPHKSKMAISE